MTGRIEQPNVLFIYKGKWETKSYETGQQSNYARTTYMYMMLKRLYVYPLSNLFHVFSRIRKVQFKLDG